MQRNEAVVGCRSASVGHVRFLRRKERVRLASERVPEQGKLSDVWKGALAGCKEIQACRGRA